MTEDDEGGGSMKPRVVDDVIRERSLIFNSSLSPERETIPSTNLTIAIIFCKCQYLTQIPTGFKS